MQAGTGMGELKVVPGSEERKKPRAPGGIGKSPVTPGRKNPLPAGTQQAELQEGRVEGTWDAQSR